MSQISIKSLLVPSKEVTVEYPGFPGFNLKVSFLSRQTLINIRKKATSTTWKKHQPVEEVDDKLFLKLYTEAALKDWSGFKVSYLERLAATDTSGMNPEDEVAYSPENALALMEASADFDSFISNTVNDLGKFQKDNSPE